MNMKANITEIYADARICAVINAYLKSSNISEPCNFNEVEGNIITICHGNLKKTYATPVKLGEILDQLKINNNKNSDLIYFKNGKLDTHQGIFTSEVKGQIDLTEKEVAILSLLHIHNRKIVTRAELLKTVWNYADCVETHTLETHIYRLRQKIEENPANPQILITRGDGYSLA